MQSNSTLTRRNWLLEQLAQHTVFNVRSSNPFVKTNLLSIPILNKKLTSPDYVGKVKEDALTDFKARIAHYVSTYEPLQDGPTPWIKIIDAGRKVVLHRISGPILDQSRPFWSHTELDAHNNMAYPTWTEHFQYPRQSGWRFESESKWTFLLPIHSVHLCKI